MTNKLTCLIGVAVCSMQVSLAQAESTSYVLPLELATIAAREAISACENNKNLKEVYK